MLGTVRDYLIRVLELAKPYRYRLAVGLLCGFLSGLLAPTLGFSLKLAVDAVFPQEKPAVTATAAGGKAATPATDAGATGDTSAQKKSNQTFGGIQVPGLAKRLLDNL